MTREFDIIVYGASGFTGTFVVDELAQSLEDSALYKNNHINWAVAGRNKHKIAKVLEESAERTGIEWVKRVPIFEADADNYDSLLEICKKTRIVFSTVGPFRFYGEPLVKACVEAATDYVDTSGETQFLEEMQLKYHDEAKKKGCYIVCAAGWDSVPADVGTTWTKQQVDGDLDAVEIIIQTISPISGPKINYGTWHSAIYGVASANELRPLRQKLFKEVLIPPAGKSNYPLKYRSVLSSVEEVKARCLPFPGSDKSVVRRSEIAKYNEHKERPVQCETYVRVNSVMSGLMIIGVASVFGAMSKFSPGRYLLEKFPGFFSFGLVTKGGIERSKLAKCSSIHTIIGYGWDERLDDPDRQHDTPPKKKIITRISGPDAGYAATSRYIVHSGMTLLFDKAKLPNPGVLTPGACFRNTYLIDRLEKRGIKFEVLEKF